MRSWATTKRLPVLDHSIIYTLWSVVIYEPILNNLKVKNIAKAGNNEHEQYSMLHSCSKTDSIKPSLLFSYLLSKYIVLINIITKTRLFKYIENFTTKNWKFSDKNFDIIHISAQNVACGY